MSARSFVPRVGFAAIALAILAACADPAHDNKVSALGPEPGGSPGPTHRPGQPCLVCHDGTGPASAKFSVAGTVYALRGQTDPISGITVQLTDALGSVISPVTNSAGNFFVSFSTWAPTAPIKVALYFDKGADDEKSIAMTTHIGRDGSCASCHFDPPGPTTPGRVYFATDPADLPGAAAQP